MNLISQFLGDSTRPSPVNAQLAATLEGMVDATVLSDGEGVIVLFNAAAERMFGWQKVDIVGRNVSLLMPEAFASRHRDYMRKYGEGEAPKLLGKTRKLPGRRRDGTEFPLEISLSMVVPDPTKPTQRFFCGSFRDVTKSEERIRQSVQGASRYDADFEELALLGAGGFGCVVRARNRLDETEYAVKKVRLNQAMLDALKAQAPAAGSSDSTESAGSGGSEFSQLSSDASSMNIKLISRSRAVREVKALASMEPHPNVVRYYQAWVQRDVPVSATSTLADFSASGRYIDPKEREKDLKYRPQDPNAPVLFIQMQLANDAVCLGEWLFNRDVRNDQPDRLGNWKILQQVLMALEHCHTQGIIHRDIKPDNIFVQKDGKVLLGDFGLAKNFGTGADEPLPTEPERADRAEGSFRSHKPADRHTLGLGTPFYASPEQIHRDPRMPYTAKADMYSLGVLMLEMFRTFATDVMREQALVNIRDQHTVPNEVIHDFPDEAAMILQLTSKDPTHRPSATHVLRYANRYLKHEDGSLETAEELQRMRLDMEGKDLLIGNLTKRISQQQEEIDRLRVALTKARGERESR